METPGIAKTIGRSIGTVNNYRRIIAEKIGSSNPFVQAVYAVYHGLVDPKECLRGLDESGSGR